MHTKKFNLGNILNTQYFLPDIVCKFLHFCWCEAICLQGINHAIHISKIIYEERPHHTRRQAAAHVTYFLAHCVPNIGHFRGLGIVFDLKNDLRFARLGVAANFVCKGYFLECSLQFVGYLLSHLLGRCARQISSYHHHSKCEGRIFVLAQIEKSKDAQQHQDQHQIPRESGMIKGPL